MRVRFHRDAEDEFLAAVAWYRTQNPEAAMQFISEVERATGVVVGAPTRWRERRGARFYLLRGFPYALVYRYDEDSRLITIVATAHLKRRPGYWRNR